MYGRQDLSVSPDLQILSLISALYPMLALHAILLSVSPACILNKKPEAGGENLIFYWQEKTDPVQANNMFYYVPSLQNPFKAPFLPFFVFFPIHYICEGVQKISIDNTH